jgi:ferric-dicitrate binding protein FerR (iron transport regulator)
MITPTTPHPTTAPDRTPVTSPATDIAAVRAALVELLTTGQHHHAATPATLAAIGATRSALAETHHTHDPSASCAPPERRLAALAAALGATGAALFAAAPWQPLDTAALRTGLCELAGIALGWLDALPTPTNPTNENDGGDEEPF